MNKSQSLIRSSNVKCRYPSKVRNYSHETKPPLPLYRTRSRFRQVLTIGAFSIFFTSAGFLIATLPAIKSIVVLMSSPTDAESVALYKDPDAAATEINKYLVNHPLSEKLRQDPNWDESRPHLRYPESYKKHSLTAGTLLGPGRIPVPPLVFLNEGNSLVSLSYISTDLCGHAGIVHGGLLATLLDEGMARCGFSALPNKIGVTARLTINYRKPTPAGSFLLLRAKTTKVDGRKVWVSASIELLEKTGKSDQVLVEAEGLFIEPSYAKSLPQFFKPSIRPK